MNEVDMIGELTEDFTKDDIIKIGKEGVYKSKIKVKRESGIYDEVPVVSLYYIDMKKGSRVHIVGQFSSYNYRRDGQKSKLLLYILIYDIKETNEDDKNIINLKGFVCKSTNLRKTPLGRKISDLLIAVNGDSRHSNYIPCICWGNNAVYANNIDVGEELFLSGRIQSRNYRKLISEMEYKDMTAYEVSVNEVTKD